MSELPNVTRNNDGSVSLVWSTDKQTVLSISRELLEHMVGEINDGRRSALTDEEREAIRSACGSVKMVGTEKCFTTLLGLLERLA